MSQALMGIGLWFLGALTAGIVYVWAASRMKKVKPLWYGVDQASGPDQVGYILIKEDGTCTSLTEEEFFDYVTEDTGQNTKEFLNHFTVH